ncbi:MAG: methylamine utilization protein [Sinobacteraceae bacterium]|nr:methylamine utilization protein [Nevskiaceae bacterium]
MQLFCGALANAGALEVTLVDKAGKPVADAVVEIVSPVVPLPANVPLTASMDQIDKEFVNPLLLVVVGTRVSFPNKDNIHHHVYSFSEAKTFELPLWTGNNTKSVLLDKPGVVVVGCNVHDWMQGHIYVAATQRMAKSDARGKLLIPNLPAGGYAFRIWHARLKASDISKLHNVVIEDRGNTAYPATLELGRDRRIRRAPSGLARDY